MDRKWGMSVGDTSVCPSAITAMATRTPVLAPRGLLAFLAGDWKAVQTNLRRETRAVHEAPTRKHTMVRRRPLRPRASSSHDAQHEPAMARVRAGIRFSSGAHFAHMRVRHNGE